VLARVAQHTLAMMLMLARNMLAAHQSVLEGTNTIGMEPEYARERPVAFNWSGVEGIGSLYDKTLGIVGFGEAGSVLAQLVQPFDMEVLYYKRRRLTPGEEWYYGVEYAELDELLERSDYVVTYVPYKDENRGMLGEREFGLMKRGAFFVNTGRANTTDEGALIRALRDGRLAGAALDVFSLEPLPADNPLRDLPNVVLTPHVAGGVGGWMDTFERIARNLRLVRDGAPPVGQITRDVFEG
jgi:phosphoglycerate dehydrogenase-like enzyme